MKNQIGNGNLQKCLVCNMIVIWSSDVIPLEHLCSRPVHIEKLGWLRFPITTFYVHNGIKYLPALPPADVGFLPSAPTRVLVRSLWPRDACVGTVLPE